MSAFGGKYARCPFWVEEAARTIRCKGPMEDTSICLNFDTPNQYRVQRGTFCRDEENWQNCPVAGMLAAEEADKDFSDWRRQRGV